MIDPKSAEKMTRMIVDLSNKHEGYIHSVMWDWQEVEVSSARGKYKTWVPYLDIQFK